MAGCEVKIEDIGINPNCPDNSEMVMFTRPGGLTEMRLWAKLKECLNNGLLQRADVKFRIGDGGQYTPAIGAREYLNPELAGKRFRVFRRGVGYLEQGREFEALAAGGFRLLLPNDAFDAEEVFHVQEYETIVQANDGAFLQDIIPITGDTVLTNLQANMLLDISGGDNRVKISLPDLSTVNPITLWSFITHKNNRYQAILEAAAPIISFRRIMRRRLFLGQDEHVLLIAGSDAWYVLSSTTNYPVIGRPVFDYVQRPNTVIGEGQVGSRNDYPRIAEFLAENPTTAVTEAVWQSDPLLQRQLFSLGDGFTTFRFPDLRGLQFRTLDRGRGLDEDTPGTSLPGRYQPDELKLHSHAVTDDPEDNLVLRKVGSSGPLGLNNVSRGFEKMGGHYIVATGGKETRGKNVGLLGLINT